MLELQATRDELHFGRSVTIRFMRTLRIPDDGREYPLPPGLGAFPIYRVDDYADTVPAAWRERGGVFIPMYQREALWIDFTGRHWKPNAVKIGAGMINAISGEAWTDGLSARPQDYVVVPDQPWLDGIKAGEGFIRQFVAMPLGMGRTIEAQLTGKEEFGGIQLMVFEPKPGRFPDEPPPVVFREPSCDFCYAPAPCDMGLGAGGRMRQKIYPDIYGLDTWDLGNFGRVYVHLANSAMFREITGTEPPPTPVSTASYLQAGLPWFDLLDEHVPDISPTDKLKNVKSIDEIDKAKGMTHASVATKATVRPPRVVKLRHGRSSAVRDGKW